MGGLKKGLKMVTPRKSFKTKFGKVGLAAIRK